MRGRSKLRGLLHHKKVNFQGMPNQATWLGWRWKHHELVVVIAQGKAPGVVPLKGEWRKRYKKLMLHYEKKWCFVIGFVIRFLNCIGHLQFTIFMHYEW
jgi:hypothetical protein